MKQLLSKQALRSILYTTPLLLAVLFLQGCMADIRTTLIKEEGIQATHTDRGQEILATAWEAHGYQHLRNHQTYSFEGEDIWQGTMGKMGKPWPEAESKMRFRYEVGSFDGQVTFLDGKRAGVTAGLQSWNYYEFEEGQAAERLRMNKRVRFGLSAYQYFFEMLDRIRHAPIISWAGIEEHAGQTYDVVYATWEQVEPHMGNDQYTLYINQATQRLDYAVYTLRENYLKMPGGRAFYGSIRFENYQEIEGVLIPHTQTVFLNAPFKAGKRPVHQMTVTDFTFDSFDRTILHPFTDVVATGDSKEQG